MIAAAGFAGRGEARRRSLLARSGRDGGENGEGEGEADLRWLRASGVLSSLGGTGGMDQAHAFSAKIVLCIGGLFSLPACEVCEVCERASEREGGRGKGGREDGNTEY